MKPIRNYNSGFVLTEVLMDTVIFMAIVLAFLFWVNYYQQNITNLNSNDQVNNAFNRTVAAFGGEDKYCEFILKGQTFNPTTGLTLNNIDLHDENGTTVGNVLTVGKPLTPSTSMQTRQISLKPIGAISPLNVITSMDLTFAQVQPGGKELGSAVRHIPILVTVDAANKITTCSTSAQSLIVIKNRFCEIQSDSYGHYDVATGQCVLNFNVKWFTSTISTKAVCPAGWKPAVSPLNPDPAAMICQTNGIAGVANVPARTYASGYVSDEPLAIFQVSMDPTGKECRFSFPVGVDASGYTSKIKCVEAP